MKYIIIESKRTKGSGISPKHPVLFPDHLIHAEMVPKGFVAVSAGDICLEGNVAICSGRSTTLNMSSKDKDSILISTWLVIGEAGMIMASCDYDDTP